MTDLKNTKIELDCDFSTDIADGIYPLLLSLEDENFENEQWFIAGYSNFNEGLKKILAFEALEYSGDIHSKSIHGIKINDGKIEEDKFMECVEDLLMQCKWFEKNKKALVYDLYYWGNSSLRIYGKNIFNCFSIEVE